MKANKISVEQAFNLIKEKKRSKIRNQFIIKLKVKFFTI